MTSTTQMIAIVSVMIAVNAGLYFFQGGVTEINPSGPDFFNVSNSPYSKFVQNNTLLVDDSYLPSDEAIETDTSGNIFTDTYKQIKSWVQEKLAPLNFIPNILKQPYGFLKDMGLPVEICLVVGVFWYMLALITLVSWWMGR